MFNKFRFISEISKADLFERVRGYSFLLMLLGAASLAYTVYADLWRFQISAEYRIATGPVRTGVMAALITNLVLSLAGFYLVRGSIQMDRETGVGSILNTTPLKRREYVAGKFLSNLCLLGAMVIVLALLSLLISVIETNHLNLRMVKEIFWPFLLFTVPILFTIAGLAVLFDSIPYLGGAWGNVLYIFLWGSLFSLSESNPSFDLIGFNTAIEYVQEALVNVHPDANTAIHAFKLGIDDLKPLDGFQWQGIPLTWEVMAPRLNFIWIGIVVSGLSTLILYLFDPFSAYRTVENKSDVSATTNEEQPTVSPVSDRLSLNQISPPNSPGPGTTWLRSTVVELRLILRGHRWWWYTGILAINSIAFMIEDTALVLLAAWLLPLSAWSSLGCREKMFGTEQILFSAPSPIKRQLPTQLSAGFLITLLAAAGPFAIFLITGNWYALGALLSGAFFIPALAFCLGTWTGNPKTFEAVYLILWYLGPLNEIAVLDYMGINKQAYAIGVPYWLFIISIVLLVLTLLKRRNQARTME